MTDEQAYERLCISCWRESQCHEDMDYCDEFLRMTDEQENP